MCGRYLLDVPGSTLAAMFAAENHVGDLTARYNAAPTDRLPIVLNRSGVRSLEMASWGLEIPYGKRQLLINARGETVAQKRTFSRAFRTDRCIVPASGFYEWVKEPDPTKSGATVRQPWCFRPTGELFAFAGLHYLVPDSEGEAHSVFVVLTVGANAAVEQVHHRMPAILADQEMVDRWMDVDADELELGSLLAAIPGATVDMITRARVSRDVNSIRNDRPDLAEPLAALPEN